MNEELIAQIREKALQDRVPIMEDEGIDYVKEFLKQQKVRSLLEVGTAVGYSSIVFASYCPDLHITTLEIDPERHKVAVENIARANLTDRITPILTDARTFSLTEKFDVLFLDGPKAHNSQLLAMYEKNLNEDGIIIIDDVYFHGMIDDPSLINTRRLKPLVRKLGQFRQEMLENPDYDSQYLQIGDGVMICRRRRNNNE